MRVAVSFSGGKDSAWALWRLQQRHDCEVVALFTTMHDDHVPLQNVPVRLLRAQANAMGMPLIETELPRSCNNEQYQTLVVNAFMQMRRRFGVDAIAFGDLFIEDIRTFRESIVVAAGLKGLFPLWRQSTTELARDMIKGGLKAVVSAVDTTKLSAAFVGRPFDLHLLDDLPIDVDPCGENGEFHTFCHAGPMFTSQIAWEQSGVEVMDVFAYLVY